MLRSGKVNDGNRVDWWVGVAWGNKMVLALSDDSKRDILRSEVSIRKKMSE